MTGRRVRGWASIALLAGGALAMLVGGAVVLTGWYTARSWAATDEAELAVRVLTAAPPRWVDEAEPLPTLRPTATARTATPTVSAAQVTPRAGDPSNNRAIASQTPATDPIVAITIPTTTPVGLDAQPDTQPDAPPSEPRAPADAVVLVDSGFRFLDPPAAGAQARITVELRNQSALPTGPLQLTLSTRWLTAWRIISADPPILDDRLQDGNRRVLDFPGLDGDADGVLELQLVATDDVVDPPVLRLGLADGDEIARTQPQTVAPRPSPGRAQAVEIPRLQLRAAVVPTAWEPPAFVVGQLKETANLSEGNTVLIGHLTGLAGDVFARLSELEPGDEVIATSRGLEYRYIVSETMVLPGDDSIPIQPTDEPRLTMMTCIGEWDPLGHDYSHRLWVVAEPAELAEATLTGESPGPLTRQLGLAPELTILPPAILGPPPKEAATISPDDAPPPDPVVSILMPDDGAQVDAHLTVSGQRLDAADPDQPLWLAVRADIEGSRWYLYGQPLPVDAEGAWEVVLELGGGAGIRHTIVVAPVDPATDAQLRRQVSQRPGEPLSLLPDAFEGGARIVVERR